MSNVCVCVLSLFVFCDFVGMYELRLRAGFKAYWRCEIIRSISGVAMAMSRQISCGAVLKQCPLPTGPASGKLL